MCDDDLAECAIFYWRRSVIGQMMQRCLKMKNEKNEWKNAAMWRAEMNPNVSPNDVRVVVIYSKVQQHPGPAQSCSAAGRQFIIFCHHHHHLPPRKQNEYNFRGIKKMSSSRPGLLPSPALRLNLQPAGNLWFSDESVSSFSRRRRAGLGAFSALSEENLLQFLENGFLSSKEIMHLGGTSSTFYVYVHTHDEIWRQLGHNSLSAPSWPLQWFPSWRDTVVFGTSKSAKPRRVAAPPEGRSRRDWGEITKNAMGGDDTSASDFSEEEGLLATDEDSTNDRIDPESSESASIAPAQHDSVVESSVGTPPRAAEEQADGSNQQSPSSTSSDQAAPAPDLLAAKFARQPFFSDLLYQPVLCARRSRDGTAPCNQLPPIRRVHYRDVVPELFEIGEPLIIFGCPTEEVLLSGEGAPGRAEEQSSSGPAPGRAHDIITGVDHVAAPLSSPDGVVERFFRSHRSDTLVCGGVEMTGEQLEKYGRTNATDDCQLFAFDKRVDAICPEFTNICNTSTLFGVHDLFDLLSDEKLGYPAPSVAQDGKETTAGFCPAPSGAQDGKESTAGFCPAPCVAQDGKETTVSSPPHNAFRPDHRWLLLGHHGSGSKWHKDPNLTSALNHIIAGAKRWFFSPPDRPPPGVFADASGAEVCQSVSFAEWQGNHYQMLADSCTEEQRRAMVERAGGSSSSVPLVPQEGVCGPGECAFVPQGWWHAVVNCDPGFTLAVTENFVTSSIVADVREFLREKPEQVSGVSCELRDGLWKKFDKALECHRPELLVERSGQDAMEQGVVSRRGGTSAGEREEVGRERGGSSWIQPVTREGMVEGRRRTSTLLEDGGGASKNEDGLEQGDGLEKRKRPAGGSFWDGLTKPLGFKRRK